MTKEQIYAIARNAEDLEDMILEVLGILNLKSIQPHLEELGFYDQLQNMLEEGYFANGYIYETIRGEYGYE